MVAIFCVTVRCFSEDVRNIENMSVCLAKTKNIFYFLALYFSYCVHKATGNLMILLYIQRQSSTQLKNKA